MAWTAPPAFVTGTVPTASWLNTYVSDNLDFMEAARWKWAEAANVTVSQAGDNTYRNWGLSMSYTKKHGSGVSWLHCFLYTTFYITVGPGDVSFAIQMNGADYELMPKRRVNELSEYTCMLANATVGFFVAAGTYTLQLRYKSDSGTTFKVDSGTGFAAIRVGETWV